MKNTKDVDKESYWQAVPPWNAGIHWMNWLAERDARNAAGVLTCQTRTSCGRQTRNSGGPTDSRRRASFFAELECTPGTIETSVRRTDRSGRRFTATSCTRRRLSGGASLHAPSLKQGIGCGGRDGNGRCEFDQRTVCGSRTRTNF